MISRNQEQKKTKIMKKTSLRIFVIKVKFLTSRVCILQKLSLSLAKFMFMPLRKQRCKVQINTKFTA